jgi:hypothetical protein
MKLTAGNNFIKLLSFLFCVNTFSQEITIETDTILPKKKHKLELNLDILSRYIWRGQSWGGNYMAVQPSVVYHYSEKLDFGFWATTNFKKNYFYPDGVTSAKGYQEIDFNVSYKINDYLTFQIWDYYWPSVDKVEGVDNSFFNYGKNGVKTVDALLIFDFSQNNFPLEVTISTLVAGNDYRYDSDGENPKQNFTTYLELAYTFEDVYKKIELYPYAGAVFNNQAEYYTSGDYDKISLVNVGIKATREFDLGKGITMPVILNYIHNAATRNTETFGKNFIVAGISLNYQ